MNTFPVNRTTNPKAKPDPEQLGFGRIFTDHMFLMNYTEGVGWHDGRIVPYGPLPIEPSCMALHYAQEVFEGMKAYRWPDGSVHLFRPEENARRLNKSCERLCMPGVPEDIFVQAVKELVALEADWVPEGNGRSLYIRPFVFATDKALGVHTSHTYLFCVICSPSGSYYPNGIEPVNIYVENKDVRAVRGGTGYAKCGGNYAASIRAGERAEKMGYTQVLWLDGVEQKYVEEVGAMNVMFKIDGKVVTPALNGSILDGITRKCCMEMISKWGIPVEERPITAEELFEAGKNGKLEEAWGTGTAAVISPIGKMRLDDLVVEINEGKIGALSRKLYDALYGMQSGEVEDFMGWTVPV